MAVNEDERGAASKRTRKPANQDTRIREKKYARNIMFTKATWNMLSKIAIDLETDRSALVEKWIRERCERFGARNRAGGGVEGSDDPEDSLIEGGTIEEDFTSSVDVLENHSPGEGDGSGPPRSPAKPRRKA